MVVGNEEGVHIMLGPDGRETGEAFVELMTAEDVKEALAKNKSHIGHRYIDGNWPYGFIYTNAVGLGCTVQHMCLFL